MSLVRWSATRVLAVALLTAAGSPGAPAQEGLEAPPVLSARAVLPPSLLSGPYHRVAERVSNDGYLNTYRLESKFGLFVVTSTALLRVRIRELAALAALERMRESVEFGGGAQDAGVDVAKGAGSLVRRPGETLSGAMEGLKSALQRVGESILRSRPADTEDGAVRSLIGFSRVKNRYAAELGVDPYSSNATLQAELDEVAWAAYSGGLTVSAATFVIPPAAGLAVSAARGAQGLNALSEMAPADLRVRNRDLLLSMGVRTDIARLFVDVPAFSPPQQTALVDALQSMRGVAARGEFVRVALPTYSDSVALFRARMARMYSGYHARVHSIDRFVPVEGLIAARTTDARLLVAIPAGYVALTEEVDRILASYDRYARAAAWVRGKQLWLTGRLSARTRAALHGAGWTTFENRERQLLAAG